MESKKREKADEKLLQGEEPKKKSYREPKLSRVGTVEEMTGINPKS